MKFCPACGADQAATHRQTATPARFCHACGVSLLAFPPPTGLPALRAAPTTLNVGALTIGLVGIALVAGGIAFLGMR